MRRHSALGTSRPRPHTSRGPPSSGTFTRRASRLSRSQGRCFSVTPTASNPRQRSRYSKVRTSHHARRKPQQRSRKLSLDSSAGTGAKVKGPEQLHLGSVSEQRPSGEASVEDASSPKDGSDCQPGKCAEASAPTVLHGSTEEDPLLKAVGESWITCILM